MLPPEHTTANTLPHEDLGQDVCGRAIVGVCLATMGNDVDASGPPGAAASGNGGHFLSWV